MTAQSLHSTSGQLLNAARRLVRGNTALQAFDVILRQVMMMSRRTVYYFWCDTPHDIVIYSSICFLKKSFVKNVQPKNVQEARTRKTTLSVGKSKRCFTLSPAIVFQLKCKATERVSRYKLTCSSPIPTFNASSSATIHCTAVRGLYGVRGEGGWSQTVSQYGFN